MLYVGVDQHKKFSQVALMKEDGKVIDNTKLSHIDKVGMQEYFSEIPKPAVAVIESTRNWYWLYELLEEVGIEVKMANPYEVGLIAKSHIKTDKIDANVLAHLERVGFLPTCYIPPREIRDMREILRHRITLVRICAGIKNRIHSIVDKLGIVHPYSDLFGKAGKEFLRHLEVRDVYKERMGEYLKLIEFLEVEINRLSNQMRKELKDEQDAQRLMSIPGIGYHTAYLLLAEIGEINRFPSQKCLCRYGGLVPSTRQSAENVYQGHIMHGNQYIRWSTVESAQVAIRSDRALYSFYQKLAYKKGHNKAIAAVARKLLIAVYHILKFKEIYKEDYLTKMHLGKPVEISGHVK